MKLLKQRRWLSTAIAVLFLTLSPCSSRLPLLTLQSALASELPATGQIAASPPIRLADNLKQQNAPAQVSVVKMGASFDELLFRGILCNILVCLGMGIK